MLDARIFSIVLVSLLTGPVFASDLERERRMAVEVEAGLFTGEALRLDADGTPFLAIYTESAAPQARGGVIIMHGRGFHADWPQVAGPLRVGLAENGWHTLSLQMPVLEKDARYFDYVPLFPEAFPRIEAGIRFLMDKGIQPVILVAHSCSVHMAMAWIRARGDADIDGFVGIGMAMSQLTTSPAWARVLAVGITAGTWVAYGIAVAAEGSERFGIPADLALQILPQGYMNAMWEPVGWLGSAVVCSLLGVVCLFAGFARFARRDL